LKQTPRNSVLVKAFNVGDKVRVSKTLLSIKVHPEYRKEFRKIAGRIKVVIGHDPYSGIWLDAGEKEVITVEASLLSTVKRSYQKMKYKRFMAALGR